MIDSSWCVFLRRHFNLTFNKGNQKLLLHSNNISYGKHNVLLFKNKCGVALYQ